MITDEGIERFLNQQWKISKRKFGTVSLMSKNNRLAARGEKKVMEQLSIAGLVTFQGAHNDRFDLVALQPDREVKIEVKTASYSNGFYKFHIRRTVADFVILACVESRRWWYLVIPGRDLSNTVGFSIRARRSDEYGGKFKDSIGRFDRITGGVL